MNPFCYLWFVFVFCILTILSVSWSLVVTSWEKAGLLALLCVIVFFWLLSLSNMLSWVRCGTFTIIYYYLENKLPYIPIIGNGLVQLI